MAGLFARLRPPTDAPPAPFLLDAWVYRNVQRWWTACWRHEQGRVEVHGRRSPGVHALNPVRSSPSPGHA
jgi:hypothetical protein